MTEEVMDEESSKEEVTHGTLYVMRERDYHSGKSLEYYKIGIVNGDKEVEKRRKAHVTGNPRDIFTVREFTSLAVQKLETLMHNLYAANRVHSGEWFKFTDSQAEALLQEIPKWQQFINSMYLEFEGKTLPKGPGSGEIILPDANTSELAQNLAIAIAEEKVAKSNKTLVSKKLIEIAGKNPDYATMFKGITSNSGGSFSSDLLRKKDNKTWLSFKSIIKIKVSSRWLMILPEDYKLKISKLKKDSLTDSPVELHALFMEAWGQSYRWQLEADLLKSVLLVRGASGAGIEGILEWETKKDKYFDGKAFKEKHPDLYKVCIPPKKTKLDVAPAEWKSYV